MADENNNTPAPADAAAPAPAQAEASSAPSEGAEAPKKPRFKVNKLLVGLGAQLFVLLLAVGFLINGLYFKPKVVLTRAKLVERVVASIEDSEKDIVNYDLGEIIVNTSPTTTMRARISIEVSKDEVAKILKKRDLMVRSRAWTVLTGFPNEQLAKVHGKLQLKDKLIEAFTEELEKAEYKGDGSIRNVYFQDIIHM